MTMNGNALFLDTDHDFIIYLTILPFLFLRDKDGFEYNAPPRHARSVKSDRLSKALLVLISQLLHANMISFYNMGLMPLKLHTRRFWIFRKKL